MLQGAVITDKEFRSVRETFSGVFLKVMLGRRNGKVVRGASELASVSE